MNVTEESCWPQVTLLIKQTRKHRLALTINEGPLWIGCLVGWVLHRIWRFQSRSIVKSVVHTSRSESLEPFLIVWLIRTLPSLIQLVVCRGDILGLLMISKRVIEFPRSWMSGIVWQLIIMVSHPVNIANWYQLIVRLDQTLLPFVLRWVPRVRLVLIELLDLRLEIDVSLLQILNLVMLPLVCLNNIFEATQVIHRCLVLNLWIMNIIKDYQKLRDNGIELRARCTLYASWKRVQGWQRVFKVKSVNYLLRKLWMSAQILKVSLLIT